MIHLFKNWREVDWYNLFSLKCSAFHSFITLLCVRFTAFSELLPLLAAGNIPLVKVEKISQLIDTSSLTIQNSASLSSPVTTFSFSATATFEVRTPSRIQVYMQTMIWIL